MATNYIGIKTKRWIPLKSVWFIYILSLFQWRSTCTYLYVNQWSEYNIEVIKNLFISCVLGMGGMNIYKETQVKIYGWTGNQTRDPCITSQVLYHWAIQTDIHGPSSLNYHKCIILTHLLWCRQWSLYTDTLTMM